MVETNKMGTQKWEVILARALSLPVLGLVMFGWGQLVMAEDEDHPHKNVKVELREWSVSPRRTTVEAGRITFNAWNTGTMKHELVVVRTDLDPVNLPRFEEKGDDGDVTSVRFPEEHPDLTVIDEIEEFLPGRAMKEIHLEPGQYVLACNLPDHYIKGMYAALEVVDGD